MGEYRCPQWHLPTVDPVPGRWWTVTYLPASKEVDGDGPLNLLAGAARAPGIGQRAKVQVDGREGRWPGAGSRAGDLDTRHLRERSGWRLRYGRVPSGVCEPLGVHGR